jgi:sarcosine oxidase
MAVDFKYIVVGRGLMGAAAARHLARQADGVAVIGPDEPTDRKAHQGVFASHYDEGRITRTIDPDRNWALLANRSIGRYGEIARDSDIDFYREVGCVVVAPTERGAVVGLGARVRVMVDGEETEMQVVSSAEANSREGRISSSSPVGAALMGRKVGDAVTIITPGGSIEYEVLEIS